MQNDETLYELTVSIQDAEPDSKFHVGYFSEEENRNTYDRWRSEGN